MILKKYFLFVLLFCSISSFGECPFEHFTDVVTACAGDNGLGIVYPAGTSKKEVEYFLLRPNKRTGKGYTRGIGCLDETPSPAWYAIKIEDPGTLLLSIAHSGGNDIDYACWGPFYGETKQEMLEGICSLSSLYFENCAVPNTTNPCLTGKLEQCERDFAPVPGADSYEKILAQEKVSECKGELTRRSQVDTDFECFFGNYDAFPIGYMVDCSFSTSASEPCVISNAKRGEWYLLLVTNFSGMSGNVNFTKVHGSATTDCSVVVDASNNGPVCEDDTIKLFVNNAPKYSTCKWRGPNGFTSNDNAPIITNVRNKHAGTYYVTVTTHDGLVSDEISTTVKVITNTPVDTTIRMVEGDVVMFKGSELKQAGTHTVYEKIGQCNKAYNVNIVTVPGLPTYATNDGPVCQGDSVTLGIGDEPTTGVEGYIWTGPNGFHSSERNPVIPKMNSYKQGEYSLKIKKDGLVYKTKPTVVEVLPKNKVSIVEKVPLGETVEFGGETISKRGVYTDTLQASTGCDSIVEMTFVPIMPDIEPTVFITPNGDGVNDTWVINNIELYPDAVVSIYDRYGRELYKEDGYENEWNGSDRYGRKLPTDDYWYVVDIMSIDRVYTGHFTLLRSK